MRTQEFRRNVKREFAKLLTTVYAYGIISTGVRIICTNQVLDNDPPLLGLAANCWWLCMIAMHDPSRAAQVGSGGRTAVVSTQGSGKLQNTIVSILSSRAYDAMEPLEASAVFEHGELRISG